MEQLEPEYSTITRQNMANWMIRLGESYLAVLYDYLHHKLYDYLLTTIFCTQYRQEDWVTRLNESVQTEAIVDRYAHTSFWIEMGSMNMRKYCAKHKI